MAHKPCTICGILVGKIKKAHGLVVCRKCKKVIDKENADIRFKNESNRERKIYN